MPDPQSISSEALGIPKPALSPEPPHPMDRFFQTDHLKGELKSRTVRGGAVTMLSQALKFVLNLLSTWALFKLLNLGPTDFGLVAMVVTVTGVINLFKDAGLSRATVQRDQITHAQTTGLFWVNAVIGVIATLAAWGLSPVVAWFYGESRLVPIMLVLGTGFLFSGLSVQHQALMQRQMQFAKLAVVDVGAMLFGIIAAIVAASMGAGYWALVIQQIAAVIFNSTAQWIMCRWRPSLFRRGADIRSMLLFGGNLAGFNIINYVQRHVDAVLVGKIAGSHALGLYGKAFQLLMLPINQVNTPMSNVAVPALSRLQNDPKHYRSYYRKAMEVLTTLTMPIVALLFVVADEVIATLMGPRWADTVPIFRWLAPAAWIGTFHVATGWVYVSLGRTDRQLRMILVVAPITVASYLLGAYLGTEYWGEGVGGALGTAAAGSIATVLLRYPTILYCFKGTPLTQHDLFAAIWRPSVASLTAGAALWAFTFMFSVHGHETVRLVVETLIFGVLYFACWIGLPGGWRFLGDFAGLFKEMMGKKNGGGQKPAPARADKDRPGETLPSTAGVA